jgi:hypothetical protein
LILCIWIVFRLFCKGLGDHILVKFYLPIPHLFL